MHFIVSIHKWGALQKTGHLPIWFGGYNKNKIMSYDELSYEQEVKEEFVHDMHTIIINDPKYRMLFDVLLVFSDKKEELRESGFFSLSLSWAHRFKHDFYIEIKEVEDGSNKTWCKLRDKYCRATLADLANEVCRVLKDNVVDPASTLVTLSKEGI